MNQRIDHSNYEAWLLDRMEGNLTPDQEHELAVFLLMHPELDPGNDELPTVSGDVGLLHTGPLKRDLPPTGEVNAMNVEDHLIARLENDLSAAQLEKLDAFLRAHPELARTERLYNLAKPAPEAITSIDKSGLYQSIPPQGLVTSTTLNDHLVARLEGDLTNEQNEALSTLLLADAASAHEWKVMQATRVTSDAVPFPDKAGLRKGGKVIAFRSSPALVRLAAAASITLLIGMAWWLWLRPDGNAPQIAEGVDPVQKIERSTGTHTPDSVAPITQEGTVANEKDSPVVKDPTPSRHEALVTPNPKAPQPEHVPERILPNGPLAEQPKDPALEEQPLIQDRSQPVVPPTKEPTTPEQPALAAATPQQGTTRTLGEAFAGVVRERVLDAPDRTTGTLDGTDAVAALDRGLKAVAGDRAGLTVGRDAQGRARRFDLRLGRNLGISASR
ncbi:MAG: hypothetical protein IPP83_19080 [Flavobacteriales bacterium]|nr:hypothetical protein [Flavobacteriales bacterium]